MAEESIVNAAHNVEEGVTQLHLSLGKNLDVRQDFEDVDISTDGGVNLRDSGIFNPVTPIERERGLSPIDFHIPPPAPQDHNLWFARIDYHWPTYMLGKEERDGIHFHGTITGRAERRRESFGVAALFELQYERWPSANSNFWRSTPHAELLGQLEWRCGDGGGLFEGDEWLKFAIYSRQTIFQYGFGPNGPAEVHLADAERFEVIQDLQNSGTHGLHTFPGFYWLPPVTIDRSRLTPGSIWARNELRIDVEPEGSDSGVNTPLTDNGLFWTDIVVRTFQWELTDA